LILYAKEGWETPEPKPYDIFTGSAGMGSGGWRGTVGILFVGKSEDIEARHAANVRRNGERVNIGSPFLAMFRRDTGTRCRQRE